MNIDTTKDINCINLNSAYCVGHVTGAVSVEDKEHPLHRKVIDGVTIHINDYDTDETVETLKGGDIVPVWIEECDLAWFTWDKGRKVLGVEAYFRHCSDCGKVIFEGYVVGGGCEYYCEDCLGKHYSDAEWMEMCEEDEDTYWTQWY